MVSVGESLKVFKVGGWHGKVYILERSLRLQFGGRLEGDQTDDAREPIWRPAIHQYLQSIKTSLPGPGWVAQLVGASSWRAKVMGSIPSRGTYKNQPMNA